MTEASADPTAFPIQFDPREQRMRGVAVHGHTPFDVPFISEVAPGLWLGGCEDGLICPPHIDKVISLYKWERYKLWSHQDRLEFEMYDADLPKKEQIIEIADAIALFRRQGKTVLVHCQAGLNRSSLILGTYLVKHCNLSGQWAIDVIRARRSPACLCNKEFERFLLEL